MIRVLFVCLGNICRSPTAEAVFTRITEDAGLENEIQCDSAGTGSWHVGEPPDARAVAAASTREYRMGHLRARQVCSEDFSHFDYVLAMDNANLSELRAMPGADADRTQLLMDYADMAGIQEVPDPYYGGEDGFEYVMDLVESACRGLLRHIREHDLRTAG